MKSFLSSIADKIIEDRYTGPESVIILPNRRAEVFLKKELKSRAKHNMWLPDFYPIDVFIQKIAGYYQADNISLSLDLYDIYKDIEGEDARELEDFLTWTPIIFNDFNDIDNALADPEIIYRDLSAVKELEHWDPSRKPLSEIQLNYLRFFKSMILYYNRLKDLMTNNKKGYHGFINRTAAENIDKIQIPWTRFMIAGVNAFTQAELKIFDYINSNFDTKFEWDIDDFYYGDTPAGVQNEAGKYIKQIINRLKLNQPDNINSFLRQSSKRINIIGVPKNIGQVKYIGQELLKDDENIKTAIVLGNESLLVPLLNSIPQDKKNKYNITLGYPLNNSQAEHFFELCTELLDIKRKKGKSLETNLLIRFFTNGLTKVIIGSRICDEARHFLIMSGMNHIRSADLFDYLNLKANNIPSLFSTLIFTNENRSVESEIDSLIEAIMDSFGDMSAENILITEELKSIVNIGARLKSYIRKSKKELSINSIRKVSKQLFSQSTIDLVGEPVEGIQIMGMLETRALDFDRVFILSANEGILPKTNSMDSFIPFDIRKENQLPLPSFKTGIYAYHFFRFLQRSSDITILYGTDSEKIGGGEKSRFILQMENELFVSNPDIKHNNRVLTTELDMDKPISDFCLSVSKSPDIISKLRILRDKGYSASLISSYITCSLKFYFEKILSLQSESIDQTIQANVFGTIIHDVLEKIYKPFTGKEINLVVLKKRISDIENLLKESFEAEGKGANLNAGKNLLLFQVAKSHIKKFLLWDISNLSKNPSILLGTENRYEVHIPGSEELKIKGFIDRVDRNIATGKIRIIDYKTGSVDPRFLKVKKQDLLFSDPDYSKAFQLMYYSWIYSLVENTQNIESGIISTKSISNGFMNINIPGYDPVTSFNDTFAEGVKSIIQDIENPEIGFNATTDTNRCKYCDYKSICNR